MLRRFVWSRNIKNRCSIYIYDISRLRVKGLRDCEYSFYITCRAVDMFIFPEDGRSMFLRTGGIHVPDCTHDHTINSHSSESQIVDCFISLYVAAWRTRSDCSVGIVDVCSREKFLTSPGIELQFPIFHTVASLLYWLKYLFGLYAKALVRFETTALISWTVCGPSILFDLCVACCIIIRRSEAFIANTEKAKGGISIFTCNRLLGNRIVTSKKVNNK